MVDFIEYEKAEIVAVFASVDIGAVVGGHGQRSYVVVASSEYADFHGEGVGQQRVPLAHQVDSRGNYESGDTCLLYRLEGDVGLPGARGQNDAAPAAGLHP